MQRGGALPVQLTEERQGDDALAGAGPARDDHDLLVVGLLGAADGVEDHVVRDLLLVQQYELLALTHLLGGHRHELLGRADLRVDELVRSRSPGLDPQLRTQKVDELPAPRADEELTVLVLLGFEEPVDAELSGIVQIGGAGDAFRVPGQCSVEGDEVLAIAAYLIDGVQHCPVVCVDAAQRRIVVVWLGAAPLLKLHDDVRRQTGLGVHPGQYGIGALAVQRQPVLQEHFHLPEPRIVERARQYWDAPLPRADLGRTRLVTVHVHELLRQAEKESAGETLGGDRGGGVAEQQGMPPGSTKELVRVGACPR